jgi:hypothetical protein
MIATPPRLSDLLRRTPLPGAKPGGVSPRLPAADRAPGLANRSADPPVGQAPDVRPGCDTDGWIRQTNGRRPGFGGPALPFAEVVLVTPEIPWADRRIADRHTICPGSRAEIRRWGALAGPDVAEELIDVSEMGVGVRLSTLVRRGERFDVTLWGPRAEWCGRGMGLVRWCVIGGPGVFLAGLQLSRRLTAQSLRHLARLPAPTTNVANGDSGHLGRE